MTRILAQVNICIDDVDECKQNYVSSFAGILKSKIATLHNIKHTSYHFFYHLVFKTLIRFINSENIYPDNSCLSKFALATEQFALATEYCMCLHPFQNSRKLLQSSICIQCLYGIHAAPYLPLKTLSINRQFKIYANVTCLAAMLHLPPKNAGTTQCYFW
jgi:hypothetical protein